MSALDDQLKAFPPAFFAVAGLAIAGLIYASWGKGGEELLPQINTTRAEYEKNNLKLQDTITLTQNKEKFLQEVEKMSQTLKLALEYLPKDLGVQDLLKQIYSEARSAGVELSGFTPKEPTFKDFYDEVPIDIKIKGTYIQLVSFLANISKMPRIITIKNVDVGAPTFIDKYPHMVLSGVIIGYRYKEGIPPGNAQPKK